MRLALLVLVLIGCSAPAFNSPGEKSTYVQCVRSSPIMGWGGGWGVTVVIDATKEGGTFDVSPDCSISATMNQKPAK